MPSPKANLLLHCLPTMRWTPHDLDTAGTAAKPKMRRTLPFLPRSRTTRKDKDKDKDKDKKKPSEPNHGAVHRRKSTISLTSTPDAELDARTRGQGQSLFFAMLPVEIRREVYEYVMGGETVHLTLGAKTRFGHFVCEEEGNRSGKVGECGCRVLVGGRECRRLEGAGLALLKTCRRVYSEAIAHLYTPHTFSLLHLTHLLYLPSRLPAPRLNTIRTLRLRWTLRALPYLRRQPSDRLAYPEDTANWARAWAILAGMQNLRTLYVVLIDPRDTWQSAWLSLEETLLEPVKSVTRPAWFELVLPYANCRVGWDMGDSRVRLSKPEGGEVDELED
ncbi:hypothetical protein BDV95DRAFT_507112 [Massariosphaeria phaeospora]|uniref:DUF7730 domain-containing protein n=1 Tax=Massariosphaeria phaeospora TaxID=100035 RepID=A0A7C8M290_9PLEO|nr:hypothetical protein BDV95DRAFT_507112 [Massariosphaeria phaeospora]